MSDTNTTNELVSKAKGNRISRKNFFKYAGGSALAAVAVGVIGCLEDKSPVGPGNGEDMVNLGSGDVGILNYAYALEQLEAAFYIQATTETSWMSGDDGAIFEDIRDHEIAHRDWFKAVIDSVDSNATIPGLTPNFGGINFSSRNNVLKTAQTFEDLGVSAYNGAGHLIQNTDYLVQVGKIVSVEARHAAAIRALINPASADFAGDDVVGSNGLDVASSPSDVLGAAADFIQEQIDASGLPQPQIEL